MNTYRFCRPNRALVTVDDRPGEGVETSSVYLLA